MLGGGEQFFAPPEEISEETLKNYARFCTLLRNAERPNKATIDSLTAAATAAGVSFNDKEIVAGAVIRHIKSWEGKKQLCYWYLLDNLAKQHRETYGFLFGNHLLDIGTDHIPWENKQLYKSYEKLLEHWDGVFDEHIIQTVWHSQRQRLRYAEHPEELEQERAHEEQLWSSEEAKHQEVDGLDQYEQPCLAYLQGMCTWGNECTMLHPPGLEGSLPPECRLGDWRCPGCGAINRHFRRRCNACPREKPQYRRDCMGMSAEDEILSKPDESVRSVFKEQFGYDVGDEAAAVAHWTEYFRNHTAMEYIQMRRDKYKKFLIHDRSRPQRALPVGTGPSKRPRDDTPSEASLILISQQQSRTAGAGHATTAPRQLPSLPENMSEKDKVYFIAGRIKQRGIQDPDFTSHLMLFIKNLKIAVQDASFTSTIVPETSQVLADCIELVYASYQTFVARGSVGKHGSMPFFKNIQQLLPLLPVNESASEKIRKMCQVVNQHK